MSVGPCPALYKYNGDVVIKRIVKNNCLAFKTNILKKNHKSILVRRMKLFRHSDYVDGDIAKTVTNRQCIAFFSRMNVYLIEFETHEKYLDANLNTSIVWLVENNITKGIAAYGTFF